MRHDEYRAPTEAGRGHSTRGPALQQSGTQPRREDPFAPTVSTLLLGAHTDARKSEALHQVGTVTPVHTVSAAREVLGNGRFTGPEDVVVIDGAPADAVTLSTVQELRRRGCSVVLLSPRCDELAVTAAWHYGVHAYVVTRDPNTPCRRRDEELPGLSEREVAVLQAVADGATNTDIGDQLGISGLTVKSHLARIGHKLGTGDRAAMVAMAMRAGLVR